MVKSVLEGDKNQKGRKEKYDCSPCEFITDFIIQLWKNNEGMN